MPRKVRAFAPGIPCHVVQRGNNRQTCFFADDDFGFYTQVLAEALKTYGVCLHAFVLMTNHVHLLMTPSDSQGISRVMQSLGSRYVRYINGLYRRSGTLWEGRYKASLIDSVHYLLICQRYIELNPVRANMVPHPGDYHWSSFQANGYGKSIAGLTPHSKYLNLADNEQQRLYCYRELFKVALNPEQLHQVRQCLQHNYPLGNDQFRSQIEAMLNIRFGRLSPGRPTSISSFL